MACLLYPLPNPNNVHFLKDIGLAYFSAFDPTEPADETLDIGGGAEAAAASSILSPGPIHFLSCT